jgi:hypothetical protein
MAPRGQQPQSRQGAGRRDDGGRRGQGQRAGTGDHQHRQGNAKRGVEIAGDHQASNTTVATTSKAATKPSQRCGRPARPDAVFRLGAIQQADDGRQHGLGPTFSIRITSGLSTLTAPPISASPTPRGSGRLSPVNSDSSTLLAPSSTRPSAGMVSPGRTSTRSPGASSAMGTTCSLAVGIQAGWRSPAASAPAPRKSVRPDGGRSFPETGRSAEKMRTSSPSRSRPRRRRARCARRWRRRRRAWPAIPARPCPVAGGAGRARRQRKTAARNRPPPARSKSGKSSAENPESSLPCPDIRRRTGPTASIITCIDPSPATASRRRATARSRFCNTSCRLGSKGWAT